MPYLLVGVGGMLGATLRYAVSLVVVAPFATLLVNLLGAFILALILARTKRSLFFWHRCTWELYDFFDL